MRTTVKKNKKYYTRFTCYPIISIDLFMVHDSNMILTLYQLPHIYVSRVYPPGYAFVRAQFHFGYSIFAIFGLPSPAVASVHRLTLVAECITILFDRKNIDFLSRSLCRNGMVELFGV